MAAIAVILGIAVQHRADEQWFIDTGWGIVYGFAAVGLIAVTIWGVRTWLHSNRRGGGRTHDEDHSHGGGPEGS